MDTTPAPSPLAAPLRTAQPWLRLVGILCWVATGFLLVAGLMLVLAEMMGLASQEPEADGSVDALAILFYGVLALLHIYPAILLLRAARVIRRHGEAGVACALESLRRLWKYLGICLVVALSIGLLLAGALVLVALTQAIA